MKNDFSAKYFKDPFPQGGMGRGTPGYFGIERKRAKIISHFHYKIKLYTERVDIYICEKLHQMSYSRLEVAIYINIYIHCSVYNLTICTYIKSFIVGPDLLLIY